jgi:diguanylate cyclase (GGDEF)-like protein
MTVDRLGALPGARLGAVLALLCLLSGLPAQAAEFTVRSLDEPVAMDGVWRFRTGDDLRWANPDFRDDDWGNILVPRDWRQQGYADYSGVAWYRATFRFDLSSPGMREHLEVLGIAMGKVPSAYELYAGGRLIGGAGKLPPNPVARPDRKRLLAIPFSAIDSNGELTLAVRVWRESALSPSSTSGMSEGKFLLGGYFAIAKQIWMTEVMYLLLALTYALFGLYHLYLYWRNPEAREYLWFGITTAMVALYSLEVSQWKYILQWVDLIPYAVHRKIEYTTVFLLPVAGMQAVWSLLRFTPPTWLRVYQCGFVVLAAVVALVPGTDILAYTLYPWQLYVTPTLLGVLLQVIWFAANGNQEARTMVFGCAIFLFTAMNDIMVTQGVLQNPRLMTVGFLAVLVSMAVSLANRFSRMFSHLEGAVRERTQELERTNEKLSEVARLDALTGLLNRRGFAETVEIEIARAGRSHRSFVMLMADIDHFKAFNDQHGHACGDFVLKEAATLLKQQLRDVDTMARWGGEEFIFLLPETTLEGGAVVAAKLRTVLDQARFRYDNIDLSLTITLGVAQFHEGMDLDDCLARADAALYEGKQAGRNRVVVDRTPVAEATPLEDGEVAPQA